MKAEILSTGDEIITGSIVDSNSQYIAEKLVETGINVTRHNAVSDDMSELVSVLKEMGNRSDIAVVTGGLGPTSDDLTAEAVAVAANVKLLLDIDAKESLENYFKARNRPMDKSNLKQAMLPKGAECLMNPVGTAPGFSMKIGRCEFFFIPGVPHEMKRLLGDLVLPAIKMRLGKDKQFNITKTLSLFGLPESLVNKELTGFSEEFPDIKLGLRAVFPIIFVKLYGRCEDEALLNKRLNEGEKWVQKRIGEWIFSRTGKSLEHETGLLLEEKGASLAVAESCTGGLISHMLTNVSGSSGYFRFSGVTYSNQAKMKVLGVSNETLKKHGAVHEETAKEMAKGARELTGATYGLSTSGVAGPTGGTKDKPVGTICIGISTPNELKGYQFHFSFGRRAMNKEIFAVTALNLLRLEILNS